MAIDIEKIEKGQRLTAADLGFKRPGTGISPIEFWQLIGRPALRDFDTDELIET